MGREIIEDDASAGGLRWHYRRADGSGPPILFVHGVPVSGGIWDPFLAITGGLAPDLPGFGRTDKRADWPYTGPWLAEQLGHFLDAVGVRGSVRLCVHDWGGAIGLLWAMANPGRVERLCVIDALPLFSTYRWHRIARLWRTPVLGELAMGASNPRVLRLISRESQTTPGPIDREWLARNASDHFDQGTQRAILRLYRDATPARLGAWGAGLGAITAPALVVHGADDPYVPVTFGTRCAAALGDARCEVVDGAGHWPWLDRPEVVDQVTAFLLG